MRRLVPIAVALTALSLTGLIVGGCGGVPRGAIATVDGVPITKAQLDQSIHQAEVSAEPSGKSPLPSPGTAAYEDYASQAVKSLVEQQVILNAARSLKISATDQQVQAQLAQMAAQYGGVQKLYAAAQKAGLNTAQLTTYVRDSMIGQMVYQKVTGKIAPSEAQMQAYYKANKTQFIKQATRTVRHILVKTRAEALKVRALLVANDTDANWDKVAEKYSIDPGTKNGGGDLGAITRGEMVKPFDRVAFSLPLDTISAPVHSQYGWHVIEVTAITPATTTTFTAAKSTIRSTLISQAWQDWLTKAQMAAKIDYAPGYNPVQVVASPSASPQAHGSPSPSPSSSK